jgi:hypothetical protein
VEGLVRMKSKIGNDDEKAMEELSQAVTRELDQLERTFA